MHVRACGHSRQHLELLSRVKLFPLGWLSLQQENTKRWRGYGEIGALVQSVSKEDGAAAVERFGRSLQVHRITT